MDSTVLIIGAGPTGLALALWLTKFGIRLRIIDKSSAPGQTSRAMVVHARILEFYQQLGIADEMVQQGTTLNTINIFRKGRQAASVPIGIIGKEISPFPFVLSFPQDEHERFLTRHLKDAGIEIEHDTELVSFTEDNETIHATISHNGRTETITTSYLLGCDGAHSLVRELTKINFSGGTYSQIFYVADVKASGLLQKDSLQACWSGTDFTLAFPIKSNGNTRLIGIVPEDKAKNSTITFTDVATSVANNTKLSILSVNWFSTYHSHHRVADHFKVGRVFLLGDAGHIHSPAGGQGMNTGIGDAVNLAWKLAAVIQNNAAPAILDTYEIERIAFAQHLIATTDTAFKVATNQGLTGKFMRGIFFPYVFPFFTRFNFFKRLLFLIISQIAINYQNSPLSQGAVGKLKGGDRLPWVKNTTVSDNYMPLQTLAWQVHVYGEATQDFKNSVAALDLPLYEFAWNTATSKTKLEQNAVYLIRPDGYIAFASTQQDSKLISAFLTTTSLRGA